VRAKKRSRTTRQRAIRKKRKKRLKTLKPKNQTKKWSIQKVLKTHHLLRQSLKRLPMEVMKGRKSREADFFSLLRLFVSSSLLPLHPPLSLCPLLFFSLSFSLC
jgi:hypothetical protein